MGASIAFYAMFAMAPMLVLAIAGVGLIFEAELVRGQLLSQIRSIVGPEGAETVTAALRSAALSENSLQASVLGGLAVMIGATGVFTELRRALNSMSGVVKAAAGLTAILRVRLLGLALVLGMGFLSIASLLVSALLMALQDILGTRFSVLAQAMVAMDLVASTAVLTLAFAGLLRWLPDEAPPARATWTGAFCSAVLFTGGKQMIGLYLGTAGVSSSYGAAGSFVVVMLWVYYTAQILLFGASISFALRAAPLRVGLGRSEHAPQPHP